MNVSRLTRFAPISLLYTLWLAAALLAALSANYAHAEQSASGMANASQNASVPVSNADIRQWYNDQVATIAVLDKQWQQQGLNPEQRARHAFAIRHDARLKAREFMRDKAEVILLQARDKAKYGNPDGPDFDYLVAQNRKKGMQGDDAYLEIIGSAERTNAEVNKAFGSQKNEK